MLNCEYRFKGTFLHALLIAFPENGVWQPKWRGKYGEKKAQRSVKHECTWELQTMNGEEGVNRDRFGLPLGHIRKISSLVAFCADRVFFAGLNLSFLSRLTPMSVCQVTPTPPRSVYTGTSQAVECLENV